jgi:superfamily II DNA helicase RecQ
LFAALKDENVTINQAMDIYRGMNNQKIRNACHDKLEMYGKGKELKRNDLERIFHFLMINNVLKETYVTNAMGFVNGYVQVSNN